MSAQPDPNEAEYLSPEEYLERERKAEFRSEYIGGRVVPVADASQRHSILKANICGLLYGQLRGSACHTYATNMRVGLPKKLGYFYPDIVIACRKGEFQEEHDDILTIPTAIIELLSDSTESYDRGEKWERYQRIPSLREYVLVAQNRAVIERFVRQGDLWLYSLTTGLDAAITLESVEATLRLAEVYEGVSLPTPPDPV